MADEINTENTEVVDETTTEDVDLGTTSEEVTLPSTVSKEEYDAAQAKLAQYEAQLRQVAPFLQEYAKRQQSEEDARVEQLAKGIEEASDNSDAPLTDAEKSELRDVISAGYEYKRIANDLAEERIASNALNFAARYLGADATIGEWHTLARELAGLGDPRLMELRIRDLTERRSTQTQTVQRQTAEARRETGVDKVVTSLTGSGGLMTEDAIIDKVNRSGMSSLTEGEKDFWMRERRKRGLPIIGALK